MKLDPKSDVPIFQQIVDDVERRILTGQLIAGEFIPSVRELAVDLLVNPNTVAKAYQHLQLMKLVEPVRGKGLKVNGIREQVVERRRDEMLSAKARESVAFAKAIGFSSRDLIAAIKEHDNDAND